MPPTDPLLYRFYELVMVNGPALKALIEEEFGDGIMSAIDFDMQIERLPNPKGDGVKITMSGKFLPYKYYGSEPGIQEYGTKEKDTKRSKLYRRDWGRRAAVLAWPNCFRGEIALTNRHTIDLPDDQVILMRYSLHEIDQHQVVATTIASDRDEALEWFSEKLRLMLTFGVTLWPPIIYLTNGLRACWHTLRTPPCPSS